MNTVNMTSILLLCANDNSATSVLEGLEKHGISTECAKSEREAVMMLAKTPARIVVVDDGFCESETLVFIESLKALLPSGTDFVFISGEGAINMMDFHKAGISCVLKKPLNINLLVDHVTRILGSQGKRRFDGNQMHLDEFKHAFGLGFARKKTENLSSDISHLGRGGFFYETDLRNSLPAVGTIVNFEVSLSMVPNTKITGKGVVRWSTRENGKNGIGIEFLSVSTENESFIVAFADLFKISEFVPDQAQYNEESQTTH